VFVEDKLERLNIFICLYFQSGVYDNTTLNQGKSLSAGPSLSRDKVNGLRDRPNFNTDHVFILSISVSNQYTALRSKAQTSSSPKSAIALALSIQGFQTTVSLNPVFWRATTVPCPRSTVKESGTFLYTRSTSWAMVTESLDSKVLVLDTESSYESPFSPLIETPWTFCTPREARYFTIFTYGSQTIPQF
jgi:hypothetical protein